MFSCDLFIIDDQHPHILRADLNVLKVIGSLFIRIEERDAHVEGRTLSLFTLYLDLSVHHFDDIFRDRHAQPGAAVFICGGCVLLAEGIKDLRQIFLAHADAVVADHKAECRMVIKACRLFYGKFHMPAFRCKFDRVSEDIDQHLPKLCAVADIIVV